MSSTRRSRRAGGDVSLRRIRLHDLRRGRASLLLAAGVPITAVSKILGHSSLAIIGDTYTHLIGDVGRQAAEAAAALVPRAAVPLQACDTSVTYDLQSEDRGVVRKPLTSGNTGADARTRTGNLPITSRLRCQVAPRRRTACIVGGPAYCLGESRRTVTRVQAEVLEAGGPERPSRPRRTTPSRATLVLVAALSVGTAATVAYRHHDGADRGRRAPFPATAGANGANGANGAALVADTAYEATQDPAQRRVLIEVTVANLGATDLVLAGAGSGARGLELQTIGYRLGDRIVSFVAPRPFPLPPGGRVGIGLTYLVTDCPSAARRHLPVPIRLMTDRGPQTIDVATGASYAGAWQRTALSAICPQEYHAEPITAR